MVSTEKTKEVAVVLGIIICCHYKVDALLAREHKLKQQHNKIKH